MERLGFDLNLNEVARKIQQKARETDIMKVASEIHFRTSIPATVNRIHTSILARNNGVVSMEEIREVLKRNKR